VEIYKITNLINGKIYVGKDTESKKNYYGSGLLIKKAIKKYGKDNFIKEVIEVCKTNLDLCDREKYWIGFYNSTDKLIGYNISKGGDGGDTISNHPERYLITEKISKARLGKKYEDFISTDKIKDYKKKLAIKTSERLKGKSLEELYGKEKAKEIKNKLSDSVKKRFLNKANKANKSKNKLTDDELSTLRFNKLKDKLSRINDLSILKKYYQNYKSKKKLEMFKNAVGIDKFNMIIESILKPFKHSKETVEKLKLIKLNNFINEKNMLCDFLVKNSDKTIFDFYQDDTEKIKNTRNKFLRGKLSGNLTNEERDLIKKIPKKDRDLPENYADIMGEKFGKRVCVDGIEYLSVSEASRVLNIDRGVVRYRLKNNLNYNYHYII
jgi:hypothetical protein